MSLESWKSFFEIGGVVLLFLTFVFGAGALHFASKVNAVQAEELRKFQIRIEEEQQKTQKAQKEAADAQLALQQYIDRVATKVQPRSLDAHAFLESLKSKPRGSVALWYKPEDTEAYLFALQIRRWLGSGTSGDGAGWEVEEPKPIPSDRGDLTISENAPGELRHGSWGIGLAVIGRTMPKSFGENSSAGGLRDALMKGCKGGGAFIMEVDPHLPENHFVVIVGQKQ